MKYNNIFLMILFTAIALLSCNSTDKTKVEKVTDEEEKVYEGISYYVALGDIESAITEYEKAFEKDPDNPETSNLYARLLILAGENDKAEEILNGLISDDAENVSAYYSLSVLAGIEGNEEKQKDYLKTVIDKKPDDTDALAMLGEIQLRNDELDEAKESFDKALEADPENIIAVLGMGNVHIQEKEYSEAEDSFDKAIEIFSEYSFAYVDRAFVRKGQGDYTGAIEDLTKAIELEPDYYWNYIDRGKIYLILTDKEQALSDFNKAVSINPDYFLAYMYLGGIYYDLGIECEDNIEGWDWDKALEYWHLALQNYRTSARLNEKYYFVFGPMGVLNYIFGNYEEAIESFRSAYKKNNKEYAYVLLITLSYYKLGNDKEAVNFISSAIQTIPEDTWFYEVANYLKRPEFEAPIINYYKTIQNNLDKNRVLFYLASYYLISGNTRGAQMFFLDTETIDAPGIMEKILAHSELENIGLESRSNN